MPKIEIEYEIAFHTKIQVDVSEETVRELKESQKIDALKAYNVTPNYLHDNCLKKGWSVDDCLVAEESGTVIVPWMDLRWVKE